MTLRRAMIYSTAALAFNIMPGLALADAEIYVDTAPPAPQTEAVPPARPGYVWSPGYWSRDGNQFTWTTGHWIAVQGTSKWVPDHWEQKSDRWHFIHGHWED